MAVPRKCWIEVDGSDEEADLSLEGLDAAKALYPARAGRAPATAPRRRSCFSGWIVPTAREGACRGIACIERKREASAASGALPTPKIRSNRGISDMLQEVLQQIEQRDRFLLTSHARPDGDAIGSALACCQLLRAMGKQADVVLHDRGAAHLPLASFRRSGGAMRTRSREITRLRSFWSATASTARGSPGWRTASSSASTITSADGPSRT